MTVGSLRMVKRMSSSLKDERITDTLTEFKEFTRKLYVYI